MSQINVTGEAKIRNLTGILTGTSGVVDSIGINVPSGIPQLDSVGKILVSQLPNSVMEYKGSWNASTNTPTLADGTGNAGDVYLCNVGGTVNLGSGPLVFNVGDQVIYSGTIWQKTIGSTGTVTSVSITKSGDAISITGSPITTAGTINIGFAGDNSQYINGAGVLTTFPSFASYVPYTGATSNVNLGTFDLSADAISGATGSFASSGGSDTFGINHSSGSGIALNITKAGNGEGLYINKTSGSGNAATIIGTLEATTLVKSGGTSSQFLKADGSVDINTYATTNSLNSYLPLSGGTPLTGPLNGTSATFSSSVRAENLGLGFAPQSGIAAFVYDNSPNYNMVIQQDGSGIPIKIKTLGSTKFIVLNNGNVGIGTNNPLYTLSVVGPSAGNAISWTDQLNNTGYLGIRSGGVVSVGADNNLIFETAGIQRVLITDDGYVHIGGLLTNYNVYNNQTASYTLVLSDASKIVEMNVGSANTVTIPTNASVSFPIGTEISVMQYGAGNTTIVAASGVTIRSKDFNTRIGDQYTGATLIKRGTNEWYLIGNIQP